MDNLDLEIHKDGLSPTDRFGALRKIGNCLILRKLNWIWPYIYVAHKFVICRVHFECLTLFAMIFPGYEWFPSQKRSILLESLTLGRVEYGKKNSIFGYKNASSSL